LRGVRGVWVWGGSRIRIYFLRELFVAGIGRERIGGRRCFCVGVWAGLRDRLSVFWRGEMTWNVLISGCKINSKKNK
jgi:hypothetical protein